eukprot:4315116-Pyramimonas_sp.AAC.2
MFPTTRRKHGCIILLHFSGPPVPSMAVYNLRKRLTNTPLTHWGCGSTTLVRVRDGCTGAVV